MLRQKLCVSHFGTYKAYVPSASLTDRGVFTGSILTFLHSGNRPAAHDRLPTASDSDQNGSRCRQPCCFKSSIVALYQLSNDPCACPVIPRHRLLAKFNRKWRSWHQCVRYDSNSKPVTIAGDYAVPFGSLRNRCQGAHCVQCFDARDRCLKSVYGIIFAF